MLKAFRNIRQGLFRGNNLGKYLLYAIGEILLVVIGIVLAMQLNNWNDARIGRNQLHAKLDQIYTVIDQDVDKFIGLQNGFRKQIAMIDSVVMNPKSINPKLLPYILYYIDLGYNSVPTEITYLLQDLKLDPEDLDQQSLGKAFSAYERGLKVSTLFNTSYLTPLLEQQHVAHPTMVFERSNHNNFHDVDLSFFSEEEVRITQSLLDNPLFHRALKSARSAKDVNINVLAYIILFAQKKQATIKEYYPDVVLLYRGIGLVGDGTENNSWEKDIDLVATDKTKSIWEKDVTLKDGFVKFREDHNWLFEWGGNGFPEGDYKFYGERIKVTAGRYHVVFNMTEKKYQFTRKDN